MSAFYDFVNWLGGNNTTYITGTDGIRRSESEHNEWVNSPEQQAIRNPEFLSATPPANIGSDGIFETYPWGTNPDLLKLLEAAGETWNIDPNAFKLGGTAMYGTGFPDMFKNKPNTLAAVTYGGSSTNRTDGSGNLPTMHTPESYSVLGTDSFNHEMAHMVTGHFKSLLPDGTHRPWDSTKDTGLTGYLMTGPNSYNQDYSNLKYSVMDNQDVRENDVHQRADIMYQRFMNDPNNQQRPELKEKIGKAMGYILSDKLLYDSSGYSFNNAANARDAYLLSKAKGLIPSGQSLEDFTINYEKTIDNKKQYARNPEEVFARAIASYDYIRKMSDKEKQSYFDNPNSTKGFMFNKENDINKDGKLKFGEYNIGKETYQAIDNWMKENKLNKTGDGFAQLKIDNMLDGNMYA